MDPPAATKSLDAGAAPATPDGSQSRRSSSRSIKRKRFDDEIVEYSLGLPPAQLHRLGSRARTQSQTLASPGHPSTVSAPGSSTSTAAAAAASPSSVVAASTAASTTSKDQASSRSSPSVATSTASTASVATVSSPAVIEKAVPKTTTASTSAAPVVKSSTSSTTVTATIKPIDQPPMASTSATATAAAVAASSPVPSLPEKRRATKNSGATSSAAGPSSAAAAYNPSTAGPSSAKAASATASTSAAAAAAAAALSDQINIAPPVSKKSKRSQRPGQQSLSIKDLGRWKPIDDLALILGVQQTNDLRMVHRGIKFSCKFTVQELQSRWYSLMYEETISRLAVAAMRNLHPELVEAVQAKALYTQHEEELLGGIKSTESPTLETFQDLLDRNALVFYSARTAKALHTHWQLMKQYALLPDQQPVTSASATAALPPPLGSGRPSSSSARDQPASAKLLTFDEAEAELNDAELLAEQRDETVELELTLADRCNKKEIRMLENELTRWTVLVDSLTGIGFMPEFDNQTLAVLRGRLVRYLMRSREISFGRTTKDQAVDVDLSLEGPAHKASRRQGTIKLRSNGDFFIVNEGKRPLFIDGAPLLQGSKGRLGNNAVIEMAGLRFIFLINNDLINAIRQESAKMSGPLS